MVLKVFRWAPGFRERIQRFWVPAKEGMTVLDALVDAQRRLDPTLAFRYACRVGMCGSCAMVVNGKERWACRTLLKTLKSGIVTVRPLYHFPLVRDLVVDMAPLAEQTARVGLNRLFTLEEDSRDVGHAGRAAVLLSEDALTRCHTQANCTEVCPMEISPTQSILALRRRAARRLFS
jgi:fumarate reductase iron-sulfur subunit